MQPTAARRTGKLSPWQVQPEIRNAGLSRRFHEAEAGRGVISAAGQPQQRHGAEFAVDDARGLQLIDAVPVHPVGDI